MKLKRAKAYRKLMHQYEVTFGFRSPYQILVDHQILEDCWRGKIQLLERLEGCLQGAIKPMITQCCMRALYTAKDKNDKLISWCKENLERRRCGHHELDEPLSALECISNVIDPKENHTNKHRLCVASQDRKVRAHLRTIPGVPLIYLERSVMIMEPMNTASEEQRDREEKSKFRQGLKGQRNPDQLPKRKREDEEDAGDDNVEGQATEEARLQKKKKRKGPKEPNPLSMKKAKKDTPAGNATKPKSTEPKPPRSEAGSVEATAADGEGSGPRKRRRKHKPKGDGDSVANVDGEATAA
ncbi:uncharacterized protein N0V89_011975 [Didymosphaeria variabile]|uniref:U three protein 23 n=1 Tax=Didymosphaeria variabile TaxID=1932322 RepID=A0A9W9C5V7_9PLEO|nr:uncharacterized protein N0V89_011975 [Didymosphaeria variabile]KAJ4345840.1 hypothetical protein N0V89_011975 [Didymosphaeria variabile]